MLSELSNTNPFSDNSDSYSEDSHHLFTDNNDDLFGPSPSFYLNSQKNLDKLTDNSYKSEILNQ